MIFIDSTSSKRSKDENGFLIIKDNPIAKAGVFDYLLSEIKEGVSDSEDEIVKVYRPFDELAEIKDNFANKPIKFNHIWVDNESKTADGAIGSNIRADEKSLMLYADLIIYNPDLIKAIESGEIVELSPAYTGEIIEQGGRFDGVSYDYKQVIKCVNHLAVVEKGRSGADLRILDSKKNILEVKMKKSFKDSFLKKLSKFLDSETESVQDNEAGAEVADSDIKERLMEIALKEPSEFEGGADEKARILAELLEEIGTAEIADEGDEVESQDESENQNETQDEGDEVDTADECGEVKDEAKDGEAFADSMIKVARKIAKQEIKSFLDSQKKELKSINDSYAEVSEALNTSFNHSAMSKNDIYKFGYETLTGKKLADGMDALTAFKLATSTKRGAKIQDSAKTDSNSSILEMLKKY